MNILVVAQIFTLQMDSTSSDLAVTVKKNIHRYQKETQKEENLTTHSLTKFPKKGQKNLLHIYQLTVEQYP